MFKLPFLKAKYLQPRFLMVIFFVIIVGFSFAGVANAGGISDAVATFLGWIVYGIVYALGWVLTLVMQGLIWLAQWNNFINAPAVVLGWKIVRDICNMFFVVIMLIIAFATILRVKDYTYEKLLPKLIIMAILINFSKMICGLLIDVSQVVMLTFVNSFKDVGGDNLTKILGLDTLTSMKEGGTEEADINAWSIMGSYVLALVYVIVALITIITMMIMLAVRIVMIWIYVVLSPLAYLLGAFPAGKKYSGEWWGEFTKNLIVGPVLAFFIWLSFAALGTGQDSVGSSGISADKPSAKGISSDGSNSITKAGSPDNMLNFVISIAMLFGGLKVAKSIGGAAGGMANKGIGAINKGLVKPMAAGAAGAYAFSKRKAIAGAVGAGKFAGRSVKTGLGTLDRMAGAGIDAARMKMNKDGVLTKTSLAQKGLISTGAAFAVNKTKNKVDSIKQKIRGDREVKEKVLQYKEDEKKLGEDNAVLKDNGKNFHKDDKGNMREWDVKNKKFVEGGEEYKDKFGKKVSAGNVITSSFDQAVRKNFGKSEDAADKKREEQVSKRQAEIISSGMSEGEMLRSLQNGSTTANEKMALAMVLAVKGGFKDAAQVKTAQQAISVNPGINKKFNDEIDKTQAHLAYNFDDAKDVAKFKKRIDTGKINATTLSNDFWEKAQGQQVLEDHYGVEEFEKITSSAASRGGTKTKAAIAKGSLDRRIIDEKGGIKNPQAAYAHAKFTGNIDESFATTAINEKGESIPMFDTKALGSFVKNTKAADLNKINLANFAKLKKEAQDAILKNLSSAKLAAMNKEGSNEDFVNFVVNLQVNREGADDQEKEEIKDKKEFIYNNKELSSLLSPENLQKKKKEEAAQKAAEEEAAEKKAAEKKAKQEAVGAKSKLVDQFGNPLK